MYTGIFTGTTIYKPQVVFLKKNRNRYRELLSKYTRPPEPDSKPIKTKIGVGTDIVFQRVTAFYRLLPIRI